MLRYLILTQKGLTKGQLIKLVNMNIIIGQNDKGAILTNWNFFLIVFSLKWKSNTHNKLQFQIRNNKIYKYR